MYRLQEKSGEIHRQLVLSFNTGRPHFVNNMVTRCRQNKETCVISNPLFIPDETGDHHRFLIYDEFDKSSRLPRWRDMVRL